MKRRIADWLGTSRALGTPFKELSPVVGWAASQKSSQMGVHGVSLRHLGPRCGGRGASVVGLCSTRPWLFTCVGPACRITGGRRALAAAGTFRSDTENIKDNDEDGNQGRPKLDKRMKAMLAWEREQWHLRQRKKDPNSKEPSLNKLFRMTPVDSKILDYINRLKLGKRRDEPPPLTDGKRREQLAKTRTETDKIWERKVVFVGGASAKESFLPPTLSEIAFIGRSNVGKSSLINALTMQGKVRVSDTPGETQQINWYHVGKHIALIDLPGYGFAFASEEKINTWNGLMRDFLTTRKSLKRICVLIDARHGFKTADLEFLDMLDRSKRKYQIVLTKADLVAPPDLARRYHLVKQELQKRVYALERIMMVSSWNGTGLSELRVELANMMDGVRPKPSASVLKPTDLLPDYMTHNEKEDDHKAASRAASVRGTTHTKSRGRRASAKNPRTSSASRSSSRDTQRRSTKAGSQSPSSPSSSTGTKRIRPRP